MSAPASRTALLIATSRYDDPTLPPLESAVHDARGLAEVLADARIGKFGVHVVLDRPAHEITAEIENFLHDRKRNDLVLVYITGHGVKGLDGRLYFAGRNTDSQRLRSSAVAASWISEALNACRSSTQLLLLDCCHSGAFVRGMAVKAGARAGATEQLRGRGRVVITASDAVQFALERGADNRPASSVFTDCVVTGLRSGDADADRDGLVTLDELFDYVQDAVHAENPAQTPQMTAVGLQGEIMVAHNPHADSQVGLPGPLLEAIAHPYAGVRRGAIDHLSRLLDSSDRATRRAAERALHDMSDDDSRTVAEAARQAVDVRASAAPSSPPPARTTTPSDDQLPTVRGRLDEARRVGTLTAWLARARQHLAKATLAARDSARPRTSFTSGRGPTVGGPGAERAPVPHRPQEREPLPIRPIARILLTAAGAGLLLLGTFANWTTDIAGSQLTVKRFCESYESSFGSSFQLCTKLPEVADEEPLASAGVITMILAAIALLGILGKGGLSRFAGVTAIVYVLAVVFAFAIGDPAGGPQIGALMIIAGGICAFAGGALARRQPV